MKKYLLSLLAIAAIICASCEKKPQPGPKPDDPDDPEQPQYVQPITIDGDFADWAKLDQSKVASAKCDAATSEGWNAVKEIRVYADELYVFFYIEYDNSKIGDLLAAASGEKMNSEGQMEKIGLPIRLNLNTDGEFTSGYTSYSLDGYDFIIEGSLAEDGAWKSFDGTLYQRIGGWQNLKDAGNGLCSGAGNGNKYEICMIRELFNAAAGASAEPKLMGDEFQAGIRFYTPDWSELSNMPNGPVTEENSKGYGHLLNVVTVASE